jgi:hypothetical protein
MAVYTGCLNFKIAVLLKFEDGGNFKHGSIFEF